MPDTPVSTRHGPAPSSRTYSLGRRVILVCIALYVAAAAALEVVELLSISRSVEESIEVRISELADQNTPALTRAIWNFDSDTSRLILSGIINDAAIGMVVLEDEHGVPATVLTSPGITPQASQGGGSNRTLLGPARSFPLYFSSAHSAPVFLGTLVVYPSLISERERVRQTLLIGIGRTTAIVIMLSIILFLAIEHFLGKPLRAMARQIAAIDPANPGLITIDPAARSGAEFNLVSSALNAMAGRIGETMDALRESERRIWSTFEDSPISLWDEDFSLMKKRIDLLRAEGIADWKAFFEPEERVIEFNTLARVRDVNRMTLKLLGIADKTTLLTGLPALFTKVQIESMRQEFVAFAGGETSYEGETDYATPDGKLVEMQIKVSIVPGSEGSWDHVLASVIDITEQKAAERFLVQSITEKNLLLREVHHRVKNNLQIVSSIVSLQRGDEDPDSPVSRSLIDIESRVWSMSLVHELLYENESFAFLDFSAYTRHLCDHLIYSYVSDPRRIHLVYDLDADVRLPLEKAIPLGLIINELVVNSLKYAFEDGRRGELRIAVDRDGDRLRLVVEDDGPGLAKPGIDKIRAHGGVGFSLVESLASQLGGTRRVEGDRGMRVSVVFPG